jgi:antitoxin YefM
MKTATVSEFRAKMKQHLEEIDKHQDVLILSGPKKKEFVLITLEAYNAMEETAHLLSTSANTTRLLESINQDKAGQIAHRMKIVEPSSANRQSRTRAAGHSRVSRVKGKDARTNSAKSLKKAPRKKSKK